MNRAVLSCLLFFSLSFPAFAADAVPDAAAAEKIGDVALKAKLGDNYPGYMRELTWEAALNGDYWFAMPVLQPAPDADLKELDGWIVQIDRHDGKVIGVYLQF